jgi:hypothetical protein
MSDEFAFYCPRCLFGRCYANTGTYITLYKGRIISAPDTPAYICDVCNYQEFDQQAIQQLQLLTGQNEAGADDAAYPPRSASTEIREAGKPPQPKP